jgi:hypothetical protein
MADSATVKKHHVRCSVVGVVNVGRCGRAGEACGMMEQP